MDKFTSILGTMPIAYYYYKNLSLYNQFEFGLCLISLSYMKRLLSQNESSPIANDLFKLIFQNIRKLLHIEARIVFFPEQTKVAENLFLSAAKGNTTNGCAEGRC